MKVKSALFSGQLLIICWLLLIYSRLFPDYALPELTEQHILLLPINTIAIDGGNNLTITLGSYKRKIPINTFWLQHYIDSDAFCTGRRPPHPKSDAMIRLKQIKKIINQKFNKKVVFQIIKIKNIDAYEISYIAIFDIRKEFKILHNLVMPKGQVNPISNFVESKNRSEYKRFEKKLREITEKSITKIIKNKD